jgi:hypothetical protein
MTSPTPCRRRGRALLRALALAALASALGWPAIRPGPASAADSDARKACFRSYELGQRLRRDGRMREARERLIACASDACPAGIRTDCAQWLVEVEAATPSIIIFARTEDGADVSELHVSVDGKHLSDRLDGKAIPLDPGRHRLRLEGRGLVPVERDLLLREREQSRSVLVEVARLADAPAPRREPAAVWVLGGVGVAALGAFAFFGLRGSSAQGELDERGCKPDCPRDAVDGIRRDYLLANVGLGVGVLALGAAAYVHFSAAASGGSPSPAAHGTVAARPVPGGAACALSGSFW